MNFYCVDTDETEKGDHIVHRVKCQYLPSDKIELGPFPSCYEAIQAARRYYRNISGCRHCCLECYRA